VAGANWLDAHNSLRVTQRKVGFVFQDSALFPHLSVLGNLSYARKRAMNASYQLDIDRIIEILQLRSLLHRTANALSGGERQRVAIGRALLGSPTLLLLDEPLSAVDQATRSHLIPILEKVFQEIDIPVLYVSHASEEVARLAENLILMDRGRVTAFGKLTQVLGQVDSPFNESDEAFSVLHCKMTPDNQPHLTTVVNAGGAQLHLPRQSSAPDTDIRLRIRARDVSLCLSEPGDSSILNILPATVVALANATDQGSRTVKLEMAGDVLLARVSEYSVQKLGLVAGMSVYAQIKSVSLLP